jgi:HEAT repeat protein
MHSLRRAACLTLLLVLSAGCASTPKEPEAKVEPYDPKWEQAEAPEPIGKLLAGVDMSLRGWTKLVLSAQTDEERAQARGLELDLMRRVRPRVADLIHELESGPPTNRIPAAAALGFTHAREAQSPLLAALHDPSADVVNNALIGLAVLQLADTPLAEIETLLARHDDGFVRSNAAWALRSLIEAGADGTPIAATARQALIDPEPFVRAQAALILAQLADGDAVSSIGELAREPTPFVVLAATRALALIGRTNPHAKGPAARELVRAWERANAKLHGAMQRALIELAGENHGDKLEDWAEWVAKLP